MVEKLIDVLVNKDMPLKPRTEAIKELTRFGKKYPILNLEIENVLWDVGSENTGILRKEALNSLKRLDSHYSAKPSTEVTQNRLAHLIPDTQ